MNRIWVCVLTVAVSTMAAHAQHSYSNAEVAEGGKLFQSNCARCHGPDADAIPGVNLARGQFRRASSDEDLMRIMMTGIPGTAMPPGAFSEFDASRIVAYLRSLPAAPAATTTGSGDAARGKALVEGKGQCRTCHAIDGTGSALGPDLNDVGPLRRVAELERALVNPDAQILDDYRFVRAVARNGDVITGRLLNQDSFSLQLFDAKERLISLQKASLRDYTLLKNSPMPSYRDKLSGQELADVISYLRSLKGKP
jgi:putative heme-binding domain-containing protein